VSPTRPSPNLLSYLDVELIRHAPFAQMAPEHRQRLLAAAEQLYYAPDEVVLGPESGVVTHLFLIRQGGVRGEGHFGVRAPFQLEAGEVFPVGAVLGERAVTTVYHAVGDTFCLRIPAAEVKALSTESAPWADYLNRRMQQLLEISQRALQGSVASRALAQTSLETPLARFVHQRPFAVPPTTPLAEALAGMQQRRVGSVLVVDEEDRPLGILTRHDMLDRVVLPRTPLETPVSQVMSTPVLTLDVSQRAHDAALVMSSEAVRHVPITDGGKVVGIVSERDLFTLQRLSLRQLGEAIDGAETPALLREAAADIRRLAAQLMAQGMLARSLTELISHLNDRLTARLAYLLAAEHGLDLREACWLAFGSEGRGEQTIATDQDNGLVYASGDAARWLAFGDAVNHALDDCGYPLCKGGIMAGRADCCLGPDQWRERFADWIDRGAPEDLLRASIFFDLRGIAGDTTLTLPLRQFVTAQAKATPRFLKQLADNALQQKPPLAWHGGFSEDTIDLKLQGTAIFVESARLLALATGVDAVATRARLLGAAAALGVPDDEAAGSVAAFEYLQLLRLTVQSAGAAADKANLCDVTTLNSIDRRVLRESLRAARTLQQRIELDYAR